jgi:2-amino-4-hydroxy-6-hydroxymethyldihydropteridine diphosphokinase
MSTVWLGLGTNIGDRFRHLRDAINRLEALMSDVCVAGYYETAPRDYYDQPDFLNTVIRGETELPAVELLENLHRIEATGGRTRDKFLEKGPRTIDIDILLYERICKTYTMPGGGFLTIPHERMHERLFVLRPLLDLNPEGTDPRDGVLWSVKASHLGEQGVKLFRDE